MKRGNKQCQDMVLNIDICTEKLEKNGSRQKRNDYENCLEMERLKLRQIYINQ